MDIKESDLIDGEIGAHWYYSSKAKAMKHLLSDSLVTGILDVGAGSGFFSRKLISETAAKQLWCVDTGYKKDFDEEVSGKPIYFRRNVELVDADLVLMMDVLEHVDDDVGMLKDYAKKVPRGSHFLISVPAFQFLWSEHDIFLEHKRRYTLSQVEDVVCEAGLKVVNSTYYFGAVFPIAVIARLMNNWLYKGKREARSQLSQHHPVTNKILSVISSFELFFLRRNHLAGLTVFCLAEKL